MSQRSRHKVERAARKAEEKLSSAAPLLLRLLRRRFLLVGIVPEDAPKERMALAGLLLLLKRTERGGLKGALLDVADTEGRRADLTKKIADDEKATATTAISTAYDVALAGVVAMGISAARVATLTAILQTMRDTSTDAAKAAANGCDNRSARKVCNRATAEIQKRADQVDTRIDELRVAIAEEAERLGIRI